MGKSTEPLKTRQYVTAETLTLLFNIGKLFSGLDTISDPMLRIWIESEKIC